MGQVRHMRKKWFQDRNGCVCVFWEGGGGEAEKLRHETLYKSTKYEVPVVYFFFPLSTGQTYRDTWHTSESPSYPILCCKAVAIPEVAERLS